VLKWILQEQITKFGIRFNSDGFCDDGDEFSDFKAQSFWAYK